MVVEEVFAPTWSVTLTDTEYVPCVEGVQVREELFVDKQPLGRPEYMYVNGLVPPVIATEKVVEVETSTGLGVAEKDVTVRNGLTVRVVVPVTELLFASVTFTLTLNVPGAVGVHAKEGVLVEVHPGGSAEYR